MKNISSDATTGELLEQAIKAMAFINLSPIRQASALGHRIHELSEFDDVLAQVGAKNTRRNKTRLRQLIRFGVLAKRNFKTKTNAETGSRLPCPLFEGKTLRHMVASGDPKDLATVLASLKTPRRIPKRR